MASPSDQLSSFLPSAGLGRSRATVVGKPSGQLGFPPRGQLGRSVANKRVIEFRPRANRMRNCNAARCKIDTRVVLSHPRRQPDGGSFDKPPGKVRLKCWLQPSRPTAPVKPQLPRSFGRPLLTWVRSQAAERIGRANLRYTRGDLAAQRIGRRFPRGRQDVDAGAFFSAASCDRSMRVERFVPACFKSGGCEVQRVGIETRSSKPRA